MKKPTIKTESKENHLLIVVFVYGQENEEYPNQTWKRGIKMTVQVLDKYAKAREDVLRKFRLLDCFCGMGGVSDGFAMEGFDVTGIDIVDAAKMLGYKHKFIQADMMTLKGQDFRGFDVIWGSPPCRDFSFLAKWYGKRWKNKPNPEKGLELINLFLKFVEDAKPTFWVLENTFMLKNYLKKMKPRIEAYITKGKRHVFYGNFPLFLLPRDMRITVRTKSKNGRDLPIGNRKISSWLAAKIPLTCSQAFARTCKEKLLETQTT